MALPLKSNIVVMGSQIVVCLLFAPHGSVLRFTSRSDVTARHLQVEWARKQYYKCLTALRPDAVALVDSFGLTDYQLNSALGRKDGDVYRALLAAAQASPLNESEQGSAWESVLKPRLNKLTSKL